MEKLPPNYFEIIFGYLYKLRPDLLEEVMVFFLTMSIFIVKKFKQESFGKYTIGIQIRNPTHNQKGEKDHKGFPVPPLDLYAQAAEVN